MKTIFTLTLFLLFGSACLFAQTFIKITDTNNPIVSTATDANYSGAAWINYDNDGSEVGIP